MGDPSGKWGGSRLMTVVGGEWLPTRSAKATAMSLTFLGACKFLNSAITYWVVVRSKRLRRLSVVELE